MYHIVHTQLQRNLTSQAQHKNITTSRTCWPVYLKTAKLKQTEFRFQRFVCCKVSFAKQSFTCNLGIQRIPRSILLRREWCDQNPHAEKQNDQSHSRSKTFRFKLQKQFKPSFQCPGVSDAERFPQTAKWIPTLKHKSESINTESKNKSENSEPNLLKNPFKILTKLSSCNCQKR